MNLYSIYPSLDALVKDARSLKDNVMSCQRRSYEVAMFGSKEMQTKGIDEEERQIINPYAKNGLELHSMQCSIIPEQFEKPKLRMRRKCQCGCRADIGRVLEGDQERCWISFGKGASRHPSVRVFFSIGGVSYIKHKEYLVCGALACAVCELLEANGIDIELWAACGSKFIDGTEVFTMVKVKQASEYIDYPTIAHVTGSIGFYRTFFWLSRIAACSRSKKGTGFDNSTSFSLEEFHLPKEMREDMDCERTIFVPRIYDMDYAVEWIEKNIQLRGGESNEEASQSEGRQEGGEGGGQEGRAQKG